MSRMQPTAGPPRPTRHMKLLLAIAIALGLATLSVGQVAACSCAQSTPEQAAEFADAAFAGTVVNEQPIGARDLPLGVGEAALPAVAPSGQIIYTFEVDGVAKGSVAARVDVLSGGDGASCGMNFALNERWLVFTNWDGITHTTGLCSGNVTLEKGAAAPLPLTAPTGGADEPAAPVVPVAVLALVAVIGIVVAVSWFAFRRGPSAAS